MHDVELRMDAELYRSEIETEWSQIEKVMQRHAEMFNGYTRELFEKFYNYACTRCFGWTLPSTMMVPLADFMNHLPIDNEYNVYSKQSHEVKQTINSQKTSSKIGQGNRKTNYSAIYKKEFAEDSLDPHKQALIKGQLSSKSKKPQVPREQIVSQIREHMETNMKHMILGNDELVKTPEVWQQYDYYSTDCMEENEDHEDKKKNKKAEEEEDDYEDDEYYYYDEEDGDEETKDDTSDPASSIAKEKEDMKLPEIERQLIAQMSAIERDIVKKHEGKAAQKKVEDTKPDYSWWHYDDPNTYFCVSTHKNYKFNPGDQIFTSYGRRSNKFLLTFYGFCIANNRHDSVVMRIRRKISPDSRLTIDSIVQQLIITPEEIESGSRREIELNREWSLNPSTFQWPEDEEVFSEATKGIQLKHSKLNADLLAYLRAHCLLFYQGEDICNVRVTIPTEIEYEILILKAYRALLDRFKEVNPGRFSPLTESEIIVDVENPFRREMIRTYRLEQCRIFSAQYSILTSLLMTLQQIKLLSINHTYAVTQLCCGSHENLMNCLNMRKYFKQLFAPNEPLPEPPSGSESDDDETTGAMI